MLEDSIVNGNKNKNTDIEEKKQRGCGKNYSRNDITYHQTKIRSCKCSNECQRFLICIVLKNTEKMAKNCTK